MRLYDITFFSNNEDKLKTHLAHNPTDTNYPISLKINDSDNSFENPYIIFFMTEKILKEFVKSLNESYEKLGLKDE